MLRDRPENRLTVQDLELIERLGPNVARAHLHGETVAVRALAPSLAELGAERVEAAARDSRSLVADDGTVALVTPWHPGVDLRELVRRSGPLSGDSVLKVARAVADALAALESASLIHRSPGPEHVIIDDSGDIALVGLRHITPLGGAPNLEDVGTRSPGYTAPELSRDRGGRLATRRAQVWGLGALVAWMATGEEPASNAAEPLSPAGAAALRQRGDGLTLFVARALQPLQKQRFASAGAARAWLDDDSLPTPAPPPAGFGPAVLLAPWLARAVGGGPPSPPATRGPDTPSSAELANPGAPPKAATLASRQTAESGRPEPIPNHSVPARPPTAVGPGVAPSTSRLVSVPRWLASAAVLVGALWVTCRAG
ncbi:MAG: hypothetical protein H6698_04725 [Myxococcales bacterium]|nr:hypothetical protein [Myxococcales bacterium]MCB9530685.1 hypothetical protein [Myxococcales bacterium]MCB9533606.1 hypothetical protein [Myxococcales bacterium]